MRLNTIKSSYPDFERFLRDFKPLFEQEPVFDGSLNASTASTTVACALVGSQSFIGLMPTNSNMASEYWYVKSTSKQSFVIAHSSGASVRTFKYFVHG